MGFWENLDGSGKSWQAWTVTSISGGTGIRLADLDGDGDLDALAAADNEIFWVENTSGNGYSWIKHTLLNGFTARTSAVPADVNHDGRLDAVMTDEDAYAPYGNQLTWFDLTTFAPKGVLLGTILDGGATPAWGPFAWEASVPVGTALKVEVRASNAPAQLGAWVQVPRPGTDLRTLINPAARFLQYRLTMLTTAPAFSPVLRRLGIKGLFLDGPRPGLAGQQNLLRAISREPVRISELTTGADSAAKAQFQAPPAGTRLPLFFQAVETGTCTASDLVEGVFE